MSYLFSELIKIKRSKKSLTEDQVKFMIREYSSGNIPDYQMSSMLMAIFLNGLNKKETLWLTQAMLHSGITIDFKNKKTFYVDKHSSGGVGDKTSMILSSIVACFPNIKVPMISGRGLGHTGGTLDKLESIPHFHTRMDEDNFKSIVNKVGAAIIGQTKDICPADKKMYSLRDVTSTIESLPLICASIMSKKLAEGINGLVLDIKCGSGAFMKKMSDATQLAEGLKSIGVLSGKKMSVLITNMNQPLGRFSGNSLEIFECVEILSNKKYLINNIDMYDDCRTLSLILASEMIYLSGRFKNLKEAYKQCEQKLVSGEALIKFKQIVGAQGGNLDLLPEAKYSLTVKSTTNGYIKSFNTEQIGICGIYIKAGRAKAEDTLDYTAGIEFIHKIGDHVAKDEPLFIMYGSSLELLKEHSESLLKTVEFSSQKVTPPKLILKRL